MPCPHCKKANHAKKDGWLKLGIQCKACKEFVHIEKVSKSKDKSTQ